MPCHVLMRVSYIKFVLSAQIKAFFEDIFITFLDSITAIATGDCTPSSVIDKFLHTPTSAATAPAHDSPKPRSVRLL